MNLESNDPLTTLVKTHGITSWNDLTEFVKHLPYGRNTNRTDFSLVITEGKGTCSSKHAFLKRIADLNQVSDVKLLIGIYRMTATNTPKIASVLRANAIEFIPEAHCYLLVDGVRMDFTAAHSDFQGIADDVLQEKEIQPEQVTEFKVNYHKAYIQQWLKNTRSELQFDQIWDIREQCIQKLSE